MGYVHGKRNEIWKSRVESYNEKLGFFSEILYVIGQEGRLKLYSRRFWFLGVSLYSIGRQWRFMIEIWYDRIFALERWIW
jgi:hypothetical protein